MASKDGRLNLVKVLVESGANLDITGQVSAFIVSVHKHIESER